MELLDAGFLKAIAHPVRLRALVLLEQRAASIRELAADVGMAPTAVGYHVSLLASQGLIHEVESRRARGFVEHRWRTRTKGWTELERRLRDLSDRQPS